MTTGERLKHIRTWFHLSKLYVAKILNISMDSYNDIERDERKPNQSELTRLSALFGLSEDTILNGLPSLPVTIKGFEELNPHDQREVMNLLEAKERLRA
jgi:transcriptional regulator with XRE-family HTH domain